MTPTLVQLRDAGVLRAVDVHLAQALCRMGGESSPEVALAVALTSRHVGKGHVCLDLARLVREAPRELVPPGVEPAHADVLEEATWPQPGAWLSAVRSSPLTGKTGEPLILDRAGRLYLARYHGHQESLGRGLLERASLVRSDVAEDVLRDGLSRLFPAEGADLQRVAALTAALRSFSVVSGGPGTGKTTTVVRILALLIEQALAVGARPPQIALLAPTGKAAARMGEAILRAIPTLDVAAEVRAAIPTEARTIHRGLGYVGRATKFRHGPGNPLAADVVIVDEASMIAFALLARLVGAVPDRARLILLGDKDQLASVEAGAVLGDICNAGDPWRYSEGWGRLVREVAGDEIDEVGGSAQDAPSADLGDCVVQLTHSWRFGADSGIGAVARAVNAGQPETAVALLRGDEFPDVRWVEYQANAAGLPAELVDEAMAGFQDWIDAGDPAAKLAAFSRFRVLCAHRRGRFGVDAVNARVEQVIRRTAPSSGEPVLVVENDYVLDLYNGDVGIVMDAGSGLRAYFSGQDGSLRALAPARLPEHTACHAMTVHKSQGSEFDGVAVLLPPEASPILTRELLYTAVTRARNKVTVYAPADVLKATVTRRIERASGLRDLLWAAGSGGHD